jgi:hypothetical protein
LQNSKKVSNVQQDTHPNVVPKHFLFHPIGGSEGCSTVPFTKENSWNFQKQKYHKIPAIAFFTKIPALYSAPFTHRYAQLDQIFKKLPPE